ncbi:MAG: hypothetical protein WD063_05620 [Pirellulales bacterium]
MLLERTRRVAAGRGQYRNFQRREMRRILRHVRLRAGAHVKGVFIVTAQWPAKSRATMVAPRKVSMHMGRIVRPTGVVVSVAVVRERPVKVDSLAVREQVACAHAGMEMRRHGSLQLPRADQQKG